MISPKDYSEAIQRGEDAAKQISSLQQQLAEANKSKEALFESASVAQGELAKTQVELFHKTEINFKLADESLGIARENKILREERDKLQGLVNEKDRERCRMYSIIADLKSVLRQLFSFFEGEGRRDEALRAIEFALNNKQDTLPRFVPEESIKDLIDSLQFIADQKDHDGNWAVEIAKRTLKYYRATTPESVERKERE